MRKRYRERLAEYRAYVMDQWPLAALDWSEESALAMYAYESRGDGTLSENNGYAVGKKWIDWQITFWKEEIKNVAGGIPLLLASELAIEPLAQRLL